MRMQALKSWLDALEKDRSLDDPAHLRERLDALDRLEWFLPDGDDLTALVPELCKRAGAIRTKLESLNEVLYRRMRDAIRRGAGADMLLEWTRMASAGLDDGNAAQGDGYDELDELASGILQFESPDDADIARPAGMVFYQPTPARHIFDLIWRIPLTENDVLIDLGSGLGHVPLLVAIATAARCIGIEREPAYVECARSSAKALGLSRATFIRQDARQADLSQGTLFYLYTPFTGPVMRSVLDALRHEAARRTIHIVTYGPCTSVILGERWLEVMGVADTDRIVLFRSRR
jgi:hypothetical protein